MFEVAKIRLDGTDLERLAIQGFMPVWQPVPVAGDAAAPTDRATPSGGGGFVFESEGTSLMLPRTPQRAA
jgi:hypothetical protein